MGSKISGNENIVLIGLPGCGKTTIGRLLAQRLQLCFFDVDEYIEKNQGKSIQDIFMNGEVYFRKVESEILQEILDMECPKLISTGGGIVKIHKNMELINKNSVILFINRPLEEIATDINVFTRPLLKGDLSKIYELYNERYPLYKKYCHYEVQNNKSINHVVDKIIHILE